ncbi:hypothetical protein [Marinimicrobium sp. ABcell2]|uniref:hypothetical protein n=1 Tax=Marinimicrobium sp. ABcell2 TaxID=3069751 RepID=UPI0027B0CC8F|nr:hypothetical protein [Marinimicrobium sp. ABcell2]MDQ2075767.1 hypothetical protein [Marinimicrobium sp. ABcell2]
MADKRQRLKGRRGKGGFVGVPHVVLDSEDYRELSGTTAKVLMMLCRQYNGHNNGDLSAPFSFAKQWGIKSQSTLAKALRELQAADLILRSRDPRRDRDNPHGQCSLYAVTWENIDECNGKMDISPTVTAPRKFGNADRL